MWAENLGPRHREEARLCWGLTISLLDFIGLFGLVWFFVLIRVNWVAIPCNQKNNGH